MFIIMKMFTLPTILYLLSILFISCSAKDIIKSIKRIPRFISFDHKGGEIDVDLDLSIPFISIPLNNDENQSGESPNSLVNINVKSLTFAALLATVTALIVPFFSKSRPNQQNYRLDDEFEYQHIGQTINELILGNNYVVPCIQRAVCSAVMKAKINKTPTGTEKIIDGISNLSWFKYMTNGTGIKEAIDAAQQPNSQCNRIFNGCEIREDVFQSILNELGIR